jgi:hypothetical protein
LTLRCCRRNFIVLKFLIDFASLAFFEAFYSLFVSLSNKKDGKDAKNAKFRWEKPA